MEFKHWPQLVSAERVSLSFSLVPRLPLSVFITSSSSPFKSVLFKKETNYFCLFLKIIALHICVFTPLCFLRSVWGRRLNGSCWIIFTMESRLKSQITRGQEREQEGGLQVYSPLFFHPLSLKLVYGWVEQVVYKHIHGSDCAEAFPLTHKPFFSDTVGHFLF